MNADIGEKGITRHVCEKRGNEVSGIHSGTYHVHIDIQHVTMYIGYIYLRGLKNLIHCNIPKDPLLTSICILVICCWWI